ncbi:MAG: hypothetical protein WCG78_08345, partial [Candidatus Omnitrophota bacterium]
MANVDFSKVRSYSINKRSSKVNVSEFAKSAKKRESFSSFYDSLPDILAVKSLKAVVDAIANAHRRGRMVLVMMGAHVIKCGLSPLIIDLMEKGVVKAVAVNGAGVIHDTEIAMAGVTSEDVGAGILDGSFGMARETAEFINGAVNTGCLLGFGIGEVVGKRIIEARFKNERLSILAAGRRLKVPVTAHVAIGTDIIHQHPSADGAAIGEGSMNDFKSLTASVCGLGSGGVVLNFGSAVIMPEVFLK